MYMKLISYIFEYLVRKYKKYLFICIYCGMIIFIVFREFGFEFKIIVYRFFSYYELFLKNGDFW